MKLDTDLLMADIRLSILRNPERPKKRHNNDHVSYRDMESVTGITWTTFYRIEHKRTLALATLNRICERLHLYPTSYYVKGD